MALPRLIEFIESIQKPTGGFVAEPGMGQIRYTAFPPATTAHVIIRPTLAQYAYIGYRIHISGSIVPNSFSGTIQWLGHTLYTGILTDTAIREGVEGYIVTTRDAPLLISFTNESGLVQATDCIYLYALVMSVENYNIILKSLEDLYSKEMREEIKSLLNLMQAVVTSRSAVGAS